MVVNTLTSHIYTRGEKARLAKLGVKGVRQAYGDTSAIDREIERIHERAADRYEREQRAHARQIDQAREKVATAKAAVKAADHKQRATAKQQLRDAETELRRAERAAR